MMPRVVCQNIFAARLIQMQEDSARPIKRLETLPRKLISCERQCKVTKRRACGMLTKRNTAHSTGGCFNCALATLQQLRRSRQLFATSRQLPPRIKKPPRALYSVKAPKNSIILSRKGRATLAMMKQHPRVSRCLAAHVGEVTSRSEIRDHLLLLA